MGHGGPPNGGGAHKAPENAGDNDHWGIPTASLEKTGITDSSPLVI